jgi:uncharacterized protein
MELGFGVDFKRARNGELYEAWSGQPLWLAAVFVVILFALLSLVQSAVGIAMWAVLPGYSIMGLGDAEAKVMLTNGVARATVVGLVFSSLIGAWLAWRAAAIHNANGDKGIPLHLPDLGIAGWFSVAAGLLVFMWSAFALTFYVLGIDPATYAPSGDGLKDVNSSAGMVEKLMADLADEPFLFALAMPGVTIAVPIVEEIVFRGALFSALRRSWFGKIGAVVITAGVWAVMHGFAAPWLFVFIIFLMGLALGWLLLRFGSLTVTIMCHAVWNLFSSLAIVSGQVPT